MAHTIEVEIDATGEIHPVTPGIKLPPGRALLSLPDQSDHYTAVMAEKSLAEDWLRPEEDAAWAYLQPAK